LFKHIIQIKLVNDYSLEDLVIVGIFSHLKFDKFKQKSVS